MSRGMSKSDPPSTPPPIPTAPFVQPALIAAPIPAQQLTYSNAAGPGRPGIVIAIAVIALIVAVASGLTNLGFALYSAGNFLMSSRWSAIAAATSASSASTAGPTTLGANSGLQTSEVGVATNTMQSIGNLDGARVRELSKMMRSHGREIFGIDEDTDVTDAGIRTWIRQSGTAPIGNGSAFFVTDAGRVDVYPDRVTFNSTDGSRTITTSVLKNSEETSNAKGTNIGVTSVQTSAGTVAATTQAADATLTPAQVQQVMNAIKKAATTPLNPAQLATVQSQISATNQQLVTPGTGAPVTMVSPAGNSVTIQFDSGMVTIGPKGELSSMTSFKSTFAAASAAGFSLNTTPIILSIAESLASVALAIFLLIVGILVFRSSFHSPRLLRIYAWIKIPLALLGALAFCWMNYDHAVAMMKAFASSTPYAVGPVSLNEYIAWGCVLAIIGLAFPLGLLIVLRGLRDYFDPRVQAEMERHR
jgi:hypothetical protein